MLVVMWTIFITTFSIHRFHGGKRVGGVKNDGLREVNHSISGRIIKGHIDVGIHLLHLHGNK